MQEQINISELLNKFLADEFTLYVKTLNYHWNVQGPHFKEYHVFLEETYNELQESIDAIAERVRTVGSRPLSTMTEFSKETSLKEEPGVYPDAMTMLNNLKSDYESVIKYVKECIDKISDSDDIGTEDFFTEQLRVHEKRLWMIEEITA